MTTRSPSDCLAALWEQVESELHDAMSPGPFRGEKQGLVIYSRALPGEVFGDGVNGGNYQWQRGFPRVRVFREQPPETFDSPDTSVPPQAVRDACYLAHEFGHFLFDRESSVNQAALELLSGDPLARITKEEADSILDEERQAWALGEERLRKLGCSEWSVFRELRSAALKTYEDGLPTRTVARSR